MYNLVDLSKHAILALAVTFVVVPTASFAELGFESGGDGPDEPGPGDWGGPAGFAQPEGGGGGSAVPPAAEGNSISAQRINECPSGNLVVDFDLDADGHPIPTSFSRTCVQLR